MKSAKNRRLMYTVLSVVVLILNVLPIIFGKGAAITKYSTVSLAFAVCSIVYALIAFALKDKGNAFVAGRFWLYRTVALSFSERETKDEKYKREFERSSFLFCITIPTYITLAFFAKDFYSALSHAFGWSVFRLFAMLAILVIPLLSRESWKRSSKTRGMKQTEKNRNAMNLWENGNDACSIL